MARAMPRSMSSSIGTTPSGWRSHVRTTRRDAERLGRCLRRAEARDPRRARRPRVVLGREEHADDGLVVPCRRDRRIDRIDDVGGGGHDRAYEEHADGVEGRSRPAAPGAPRRRSPRSPSRARRSGSRGSPRPGRMERRLLAGGRRGRRQLEALGSAGVGAEDREPPGIGEHGDTTAARERLRREQRGRVEELRERARALDTGLTEERVDRDLRARERGGVRCRSARTGRGCAALEREHRLPARHAPGDPSEAQRVAEALEIERDDGGRLVVLPVLEQVVRRDVCLVAERHERRESEPSAACLLDDGEPERAALRGEAHAACRQRLRGEGRVQPRRGRRDAETVRADQSSTVCAYEREQARPDARRPRSRPPRSRPRRRTTSGRPARSASVAESITASAGTQISASSTAGSTPSSDRLPGMPATVSPPRLIG